MTYEQAAAKLNEHMVKMGITPQYELIHSDTGTHINNFIIRVKCPVELNGKIYTADGSGRSKKEAKHQAAFIFMQKYLGDRNNNPVVSARKMSTPFTCAVNVTEPHKNTLLLSICVQYNLPKPDFEELESTGPPHAKRFTFVCRVSPLRTEGKGDTKSEAKLQATTKMIQLLMQELEVCEVFESPRSTVANDREIVSFSDNLKGSQLPISVGIFGRRRSSSTISNVFSTSDTSSVISSVSSKIIDLRNTVIGVFNHSKKSDCTAGSSSDDSSSNISLIDQDIDSQPKTTSLNKAKSKSMTDLFDDTDSKISNEQLLRNLSFARAISRIDATLENVEKQLYNEVLNTLENRELPRRRPVVFLCREYEVCINHGSRPKILEGDQECIDPTIRIAALTKLLIDMKNHAAIVSCTKLIK